MNCLIGGKSYEISRCSDKQSFNLSSVCAGSRVTGAGYNKEEVNYGKDSSEGHPAKD